MTHSFSPVDLFQYGFFFAVDVLMVGCVVLALRLAFYALIAPSVTVQSSDTEAEE